MVKKILPQVWDFGSCTPWFFAGQTEMVMPFMRKKFCYTGSVTQEGAPKNLV